MKTLLLFLFLLIPNILAPAEGNKPDIDKILQERKYDKLYNDVIESLKEFEGLRLETYYCPAGFKTIGYGHLIRPKDRFPQSIGESVADSLLRADFDIAVTEVTRLTKYNKYANAEKVLSLAHFVFNVGSLRFQESRLLSLVSTNQPVKYEFMKWVHYRDKDSTVIVSNHLKTMRQYEANLFMASVN
jgi:lysozyme